MKVGKEEIVGLVAAVNLYVARDHDHVHATWNKKVNFLVAELQGIPGVTAQAQSAANGHDHGFLELVFRWDPKIIPLTSKAIAEELRSGEPRVIYYPEYGDEHSGVVQTRSMKEGEEIRVAHRLRQLLLAGAKRNA